MNNPTPHASLASFMLTLALAAGTASAGVSEYLFNTTTGIVTLNGTPTTTINGVTIVNRGTAGSTRTWSIQGDMSVPAGMAVNFTGTNLAKVIVGGNLIVPASCIIDASGDGGTPGPGGGLAGGGGGSSFSNNGGNGGAGNSINGLNGQNGVGSNGGNAGTAPRIGGFGPSGDTNTGANGGSGAPRLGGSAGGAGGTGVSGGAGGLGVNNSGTPAPLTTGGAGGVGGQGANPGGSGGTGGQGGPGITHGNGTNGQPGEDGWQGQMGFSGVAGSAGSNGHLFVPGAPAIATLNAGNGGAGGSSGGTGGGGAGGSSGAGAGGGGAGGGFVFSGDGGGGGGGGAGASGGRGGEGGSGGIGGNGGGGGGGLQFIVQGRIELAGQVHAIGGNRGFSSGGFFGAVGDDGGVGGTGGSGGNSGTSQGGAGGHGGDGGPGGNGGTGGAGGFGGGGTGGAIFLTATAMAGTGSVSLSGGTGTGVAPNGRLLLSDAAASIPSIATTETPSLLSKTLDFVPTAITPYFGSTPSPNIVPDASGNLPGLEGGPGPFGLLPSTFADATITSAIAAAPSRARGLVVRYPAGPSGFTLGYNITSPSTSANTFDMFVLVNLSGSTQPCTFDGVPTGRFPFTRRAEFGGPGTRETVNIPALRSWACLGADLLAVAVPVSVGPFSAQLTIPDADANPVVRYIIEPCGVADVGSQGGVAGADGVLDNNDFVAFIDFYFNNDLRADIGKQGGLGGPDGLLNNNDFVAFIDRFFAGC